MRSLLVACGEDLEGKETWLDLNGVAAGERDGLRHNETMNHSGVRVMTRGLMARGVDISSTGG